MNNELVKKVMDLSREFLENDDKESALALFNIAEKLVKNQRKNATGMAPIDRKPKPVKRVKPTSGGAYQGGGCGSYYGGSCGGR